MSVNIRLGILVADNNHVKNTPREERIQSSNEEDNPATSEAN